MKTDATPVRPDERFGEYCTPPEAAVRKGVARSAVYDALQAGRLQAFIAIGQIVVRLVDVDAWEVRTNARRPKEHL